MRLSRGTAVLIKSKKKKALTLGYVAIRRGIQFLVEDPETGYWLIFEMWHWILAQHQLPTATRYQASAP